MEKKNYKIHPLLIHLKDILLVTLLGMFVSFLFYRDFETYRHYIVSNAIYSALIGTLLWKGNVVVGYFVNRRFNINTEPVKAIWWQLAAMFIYTIAAIILFNYLWAVFVYKEGGSYLLTKGGLITIFVQFIITVIIASILISVSFFKSWREAAVNEEKLKRESIALQYKALKNQVNPHFLFNSLNTLTSLVYQNQDTAVKFIKQLSDIYRYILEHESNELVMVNEEIDFVRKYSFLQKIRFGENLDVEINTDNGKGKFIVPASVQMLVENAIKHNVVSSEYPLTIEIYCDRDYIIVRNNLQLKSATKDSGGIGLGNIRSRYSFLTDKQLITEKNDKEFVVKLPLLTKTEKI